MRISSQMMSKMLSDNIQQTQKSVYGKAQQVASGKLIQKASDDPASWGRCARMKDRQEMLGQYGENARLAESQLLAVDKTLSSITTTLQRASELAVQASDSTLGAADREVFAVRMNQLLEQLLDQSNSTYAGSSLLGGSQGSSAPFEPVRNADGQIESVAYAGNSVAPVVEVADGDAIPVRFVGGGSDRALLVSGTSDAFGTLVEMRDRLLAGESLVGSGLQEAVDAAIERVIVGRASAGAYLEHLSFAKEIRDAREIQLAEGISDEEDLDMAQAVTELSKKQTAYQAALAMATQVSKLSLLNYL